MVNALKKILKSGKHSEFLTNLKIVLVFVFCHFPGMFKESNTISRAQRPRIYSLLEAS